MDPSINAMSLELEQRESPAGESPVVPSVGHIGVENVQFLLPEHRESFQEQLNQLRTEFDISDPRQDVPMREFLKWRMRCLWFLYRYLGSGNPYYAEFVLTLSRETDPHVDGRFVIAGKALLDALLSDLDDGFLFHDHGREDLARGRGAV
jgi:hypothetical protein